jgi:hypothetical protein
MDCSGITDLYFFDHCGEKPGWLQFGDVDLKDEDGSLKQFCNSLRDLLPKGCVIHFGECLVAKDLDGKLIEDLAKWTERDVVGASCDVSYTETIVTANGKVVSREPRENYYIDKKTGLAMNLPDYYIDDKSLKAGGAWVKVHYDTKSHQYTETTCNTEYDPWYKITPMTNCVPNSTCE